MGPYALEGIPYAAPPTGPLRWHAPRPPAAWKGDRDATHFGASCMQHPHAPFQPPPRARTASTSTSGPPTCIPTPPRRSWSTFTAGPSPRAPALCPPMTEPVSQRAGRRRHPQLPPRRLRILRPSRPHRSLAASRLRQLRPARSNGRPPLGPPEHRRFWRQSPQRHRFGESAGATSVGYLMVSGLSPPDSSTAPSSKVSACSSPTRLN